MNERNQGIAESYKKGVPVPEISRMYGVETRSVYQILKSMGVPRTRRTRNQGTKTRSVLHDRIGRRVYDYYFNNGLDRREAADQLGWTSHKLRNVELGRYTLTIEDVVELSEWMNITPGEFFDGLG